jgi:hypothetical protein
MRAGPGQVVHFSEDPSITRFVPHVAPTSAEPDPYVWAVDHDRCPDYWFPRECPRAMIWAQESTTDADRQRLLGPGGARRVHLVEYGWLERIRTVRLYGYRFDARDFRPIGEPPNAHVSTVEVAPLGPAEPVGDLFRLHERAGIELRVVVNLWPFWHTVIGSSVGYSGIRLRNAVPAPISRTEKRTAGPVGH